MITILSTTTNVFSAATLSIFAENSVTDQQLLPYLMSSMSISREVGEALEII